ncbi:MAG: hypothetical protein ACOYCB_13205, partial [Fastidiosipilaceae bacterium]
MRDGLIDGTYPAGRYERFTVYEPKERIICAAAFSERVLHHALMNVIEPWLEKWLIFDIYACRKGKGQLRAVKRAQAFAHCHTWFLKCDFRKYFDSIPQDGLMRMVERRFKDKKLRSSGRTPTCSLSQSGSMVISPSSDSAILSSTERMSRCRGVPS